MKKKYIFVLILLVFMVGCSSVNPEISMKPPVYVEQLPQKYTNNYVGNQGSLFGRGDNPLFADRKAMNVNDIVTVVIEESANQASRANKSTNKDSTIALEGGLFSSPDGSFANKITNGVNSVTGISFRGGGSNQYSGGGSNSRNETFNTTISARIIKVLNNGNYFIEGSKEILINNEKQIIQISGVIRPYDISQNNQISSRLIADAKILYKTEGDIDRATQKPWGSRILETIWPF